MKRDRKEISRLKREILQLRKLLQQQEQESRDAKEIIEEEEEREKEHEKQSKPRIKCSKCKGDAELIELGSRGTYKVCTDRANCWHREKYK